MAIYSVKKPAIDIAVEEEFAFEPNMEGALAIVAESEENYNKIMKAIGISELNHFEATGMEMVYEAGKVQAFFGKVKEFFIKLGKKIKAMLQKFIQWIDSFTKSGDEFVKKYGEQLKNKKEKGLEGFEFEGFEFTYLDGIDNLLLSTDSNETLKDAMGSINDASIENAKDMDALMDAFSNPDLADILRGKMLGEDKVEAGEFTEKLYAHFRNGETKRKAAATLNKNHVDEALKNIKEAKKNINDAKEAYKKIQKDLDNIVNKLKTAEAKMTKKVDSEDAGKAVAVVQKSVVVLKTAMGLNVTAKGAYLSALRERNMQSRAFCFKALSYRTEDQKQKEKLFGEGFTHFTEGFLDNVILK